MKTYTECKALGSGPVFTLASIHSQAESDFIYDEFSGRMWVGAYRTGPGNSFEWEDGSPYDFDYWYTGEPNFSFGKENHIIINWWGDGRWNDEAEWFTNPCLFIDNVSK